MMASTPAFDVTPPSVATNMGCQIESHRAPKSKLKSLFAWRRLSSTEQTRPRPSFHESDAEPTLKSTEAPSTMASEQMSGHSQEAHSEPLLPRRAHRDSKLRHQSRSQHRPQIAVDARLFAYACSHASLRSVLQVPAKGLLDRLSFGAVNRSSLTATEVSPSASQLASIHGSDPIRSFHNDVSTHHASQLTERVLVLCNGGSIFQYKVDGPSDRLPEKMLQLTHESTAFASDAIVGKHWVLSVSASGGPVEDGKMASPSSPWSILSFRSAESRRATENLLLVFDSPEQMAVWMSALRKEIESLGGDHYRSNTPDIRSGPMSPSSFCSSERKGNLLRLSRSSSSLKVSSTMAQLEKELPKLPIPPTYTRTDSARSMTASSIATTTSLDRLRDSDAGSTTTGTTNSLDGSVTLDSPVKATFAENATFMPLIEARTNVSSEQKSRTSTLVTVRANSHDNKPSISRNRGHNRSSSSVNSDSLRRSFDQGQDASPSTRSDSRYTSRSNIARPVAILPPLPSPDAARRPSFAERTLSADCVGTTILAIPPRPKTSHERHVSKLSLDQSKSSYSLFPRPRVQETKTCSAVIAETDLTSKCSHGDATSYIGSSPLSAPSETSSTNLNAGKLAGKKPSPLKLFAPVYLEQPQRSPAVTEDMLASNFGTALFGPQHSPLSPKEIQVPSIDDLKFDFSFLKTDFASGNTSPVDENAPNARKQRSTPNLRHSRMPAAPVGPPPKGPLPAVPLSTESLNATPEQVRPSDASSQAKRSQSQHTRRTSSRSTVTRSQLRPPSVVVKSRNPSKSTITPPGSKRNSITARNHSPSPPKAQRNTSLGTISICSPNQGQGQSVHKKNSISHSQERGRSIHR